MLNLHQVQTFLEHLPIRDRDTGRMINFRLNPNQQIVMDRLKAQYDKGKPLWYICLKSRRVGMSALADALLTCHCLGKKNAEALIVAHQYKSSTALFQIPKMLVQGLPFAVPIPTQHKIVFNHPSGNSTLSLATAGSTQGGRGLTLSALHLSEAAFFPGSDSFTSLIPAVSYNPDTILVLESTANGRVGPGEAFYQYWQAAVEGRNEFIPIFLSWLDDPGAFRPSSEAKGAPADAEEKEVMAFIKARGDHSKDQILQRIAWRRWALETRCQGMVEMLHQEFPITPEEAFVSTNAPAFDKTELSYARSTCKPPLAEGLLVRDSATQAHFEERVKGDWLIWERPDPTCRYYVGADPARGEEIGESGTVRSTGDFACIVVWNGTTGEQAARYAARISPERLANECDMIGRYYNKAMILIELTGNLGLWAQVTMRDRYKYPNLYRWLGRDDKMRNQGNNKRSALGWETNVRTREMAFNAFRSALREERIMVRDRALLAQMENASQIEGFRWEVIRGHDDILMAALLSWICREQYPPATNLGGKRPDTAEDDAPKIHYTEDAQTALIKHHAKVMSYTRRRASGKELTDPLYGI